MLGQTVLLGLLALVAAARCQADVEVPAEESLEARPLGGLLQALVNNPVCQGRATSCSADCTSLVKCAYVTDVWQYVVTSKCPAATPYCTLEGNAASCTATPPSSGATCNPAPPDPIPANAYNCSADGYWPDLTSCTRYYLCVGNNAYRFDCSAFPGTVYDQRTTHCVPKSRGTCYTLHCTDPKPNKPVQYQVYTPAPWIYAVCTSKDASKALVGTCGDQRLTMDQSGVCVERCDQEGRFSQLGAAAGGNGFVDCVALSSSKLSAPTPGVCPTGTTFSEAQGQCVV
ncbi:uncharacterized protein LOC117643823 isoform X1 [Thrips palmi]|uniref:Uncharacterized protein LOC117643823 isoform X1 n=1 Tax=Thrips palmi TaxID=161013 RepID=A0A6P8YXA1_THRPL|nr:uncharacterized protein LOC117643823 isoform X1 [Thrips palmi]